MITVSRRAGIALDVWNEFVYAFYVITSILMAIFRSEKLAKLHFKHILKIQLWFKANK